MVAVAVVVVVRILSCVLLTEYNLPIDISFSERIYFVSFLSRHQSYHSMLLLLFCCCSNLTYIVCVYVCVCVHSLVESSTFWFRASKFVRTHTNRLTNTASATNKEKQTRWCLVGKQSNSNSAFLSLAFNQHKITKTSKKKAAAAAASINNNARARPSPPQRHFLNPLWWASAIRRTNHHHATLAKFKLVVARFTSSPAAAALDE